MTCVDHRGLTSEAIIGHRSAIRLSVTHYSRAENQLCSQKAILPNRNHHGDVHATSNSNHSICIEVSNHSFHHPRTDASQFAVSRLMKVLDPRLGSRPNGPSFDCCLRMLRVMQIDAPTLAGRDLLKRRFIEEQMATIKKSLCVRVDAS